MVNLVCLRGALLIIYNHISWKSGDGKVEIRLEGDYFQFTGGLSDFLPAPASKKQTPAVLRDRRQSLASDLVSNSRKSEA